jgi:RpiB/LacA/LacB family sugar-phosphate isomerase
MDQITDIEIHEIVQKVLGRMQGAPSDSDSGLYTYGRTPQDIGVEKATHSSHLEKDNNQVVAIGADHGGYDMKTELIVYIKELGYKVTDCGTNDKNSVDYPDFAYAVAQLVAEERAWRGIVIDGAGIGSCMTANKVFGIRAAMCYDYATAVNSREHNDANLLTLGAGLIGLNLAKQIVSTWLKTDFLGGRHARRVDKIKAIEKKFLRG